MNKRTKIKIIRVFLAVSFFSSIIFAQDYLKTKSEKEITGDLKDVKDGYIMFEISGNNFPSRIPFSSILELKLEDGSMPDWYIKILEVNKREVENAKLKDFIIGNKVSKLFHKGGIGHMPNEDQREIFKSEHEASGANYEPCRACFDDSIVLPDYNLELQIAKSVNGSIRNQNDILYDHPKLSLFKSRLEKILSGWVESLKGYDYSIQILNDKTPNAFAVAGGNIYITTGLIDLIEHEKEIDFILSHEIAHIERRHTLRGYKKAQRQQESAAFATAAVGLGILLTSDDIGSVKLASNAMNIAETVFNYANTLSSFGYSRHFESEADVFSQLYMERENKGKKEIINILDKLANYSLSRGYSIGSSAYSSHPNIINRINSIKFPRITTFDEPISFNAIATKKGNSSKNKTKSLNDKLLTINTKMLFVTKSLEKQGYQNITFVGELENYSQLDNYEINKFSISDKGITDRGLSFNFIDLDGLVAIKNKKVDFAGTLELQSSLTNIFIKNLEDKTPSFQLELSKVSVNKGESAKKNIFNYIPFETNSVFGRGQRIISNTKN